MNCRPFLQVGNQVGRSANVRQQNNIDEEKWNLDKLRVFQMSPQEFSHIKE
jgi:hypothetical protein